MAAEELVLFLHDGYLVEVLEDLLCLGRLEWAVSRRQESC